MILVFATNFDESGVWFAMCMFYITTGSVVGFSDLGARFSAVAYNNVCIFFPDQRAKGGVPDGG